MDYKEKYEHALERAKNLHKDAIDMGENIRAKQCEIIFPELKESEDEKIRKVLIDYFNAYPKDYFGGLKKSYIVAWLEKQGTSYTKKDVDDAFVEGMAFAKDELEKQCEKPAWSEEDERICRNIINDIANDKSMCKFEISRGICDEQINWLKSLKQRIKCE